MKILQGQYKGRRLQCPPGRIRPTTSKMRESLFAGLETLAGKSLLDLFSGSGIVAIEALSHYARRVVLVESDRKKYPVLHENCRGFDEETLSIYRGRVETFIQQWRENFDIIFVDPPFAYPQTPSLVKKIQNSALVKEGSIIIIHHPDSRPLTKEGQTKQQRFGTSTLSFYTI